MIRTINFLCVAITGLMCLGLYHVAEAARVTEANVNGVQRQITREQNAMVVMQAEWARLTQPGRIAALASRHLALTDKPAVELSSLTSLPRRGDEPLVPPSDIRTAKAVVPQAQQQAQTPVAVTPVVITQPKQDAAPAPRSTAAVEQTPQEDTEIDKTPVVQKTGA
jgi:hypothetical protein